MPDRLAALMGSGMTFAYLACFVEDGGMLTLTHDMASVARRIQTFQDELVALAIADEGFCDRMGLRPRTKAMRAFLESAMRPRLDATLPKELLIYWAEHVSKSKQCPESSEAGVVVVRSRAAAGIPTLFEWPGFSSSSDPDPDRDEPNPKQVNYLVLTCHVHTGYVLHAFDGQWLMDAARARARTYDLFVESLRRDVSALVRASSPATTMMMPVPVTTTMTCEDDVLTRSILERLVEAVAEETVATWAEALATMSSRCPRTPRTCTWTWASGLDAKKKPRSKAALAERRRAVLEALARFLLP